MRQKPLQFKPCICTCVCSPSQHRQTRKYMQNYIKPGVKLIDMCEHLEATVRSLIQADGLNAGTCGGMGCAGGHVTCRGQD